MDNKIGSNLMKNIILAVLVILLVACAQGQGRESLTFTERVAADREWYCGEGMFGIRAVFRFGLRLFGVPIPDACKVLDVIIDDAEKEEIVLDT